MVNAEQYVTHWQCKIMHLVKLSKCSLHNCIVLSRKRNGLYENSRTHVCDYRFVRSQPTDHRCKVNQKDFMSNNRHILRGTLLCTLLRGERRHKTTIRQPN
jgi:hypothetical protein